MIGETTDRNRQSSLRARIILLHSLTHLLIHSEGQYNSLRLRGSKRHFLFVCFFDVLIFKYLRQIFFFCKLLMFPVVVKLSVSAPPLHNPIVQNMAATLLEIWECIRLKSRLIKDGLVDEAKEDVSARLRVITASKSRNLSWVVLPLDTGFLSCFMVNTSQRKIMGQLLLFWSSRQDSNISSHCRSNRPFSIY